MSSLTTYIALDSLKGLPRLVDSRSTATCEVVVWQQEERAIVLLLDRGAEALVARSADMLIPFVIAMVLPRMRVPWRNVRWFQRDSAAHIDEMIISDYRGGIQAEIDWLPRPAQSRSWNGFATIAAVDGFAVGHVDIGQDEDVDSTICQRDHAASFHACQ